MSDDWQSRKGTGTYLSTQQQNCAAHSSSTTTEFARTPLRDLFFSFVAHNGRQAGKRIATTTVSSLLREDASSVPSGPPFQACSQLMITSHWGSAKRNHRGSQDRLTITLVQIGSTCSFQYCINSFLLYIAFYQYLAIPKQLLIPLQHLRDNQSNIIQCN